MHIYGLENVASISKSLKRLKGPPANHFISLMQPNVTCQLSTLCHHLKDVWTVVHFSLMPATHDDDDDDGESRMRTRGRGRQEVS